MNFGCGKFAKKCLDASAGNDEKQTLNKNFYYYLYRFLFIYFNVYVKSYRKYKSIISRLFSSFFYSIPRLFQSTITILLVTTEERRISKEVQLNYTNPYTSSNDCTIFEIRKLLIHSQGKDMPFGADVKLTLLKDDVPINNCISVQDIA